MQAGAVILVSECLIAPVGAQVHHIGHTSSRERCLPCHYHGLCSAVFSSASTPTMPMGGWVDLSISHVIYPHRLIGTRLCSCRGGQASAPRSSPGNSQGNPMQSAIIDFISWSHLKQEITYRLILESNHQGCSPLAKVVLDAVIVQFALLAPIQCQCFWTVVIHCAMNVHISQQ